MQNMLWLMEQFKNPYFWIIPCLSCLLLAVWPAIIGYLEDKSSRINDRR